ncbi:hypothetical protein CRUP_001252 [Coryphaenoides rupestris]|nr:hypothetical protein CRUP_001252 [Coryphaenoides rupestris]
MLRADRRADIPESTSSMDGGPTWRPRLPGLSAVAPRMSPGAAAGPRPSFTTAAGVKGGGRERESGGAGVGRQYKSVTMAPTSRYLSDRRAAPALDLDKSTAFASPFLDEGSDQGSLSSLQSLEVHSPTPPPSPRLTSTLLLPAGVSPHLCLSGPLWSDARPERRSRVVATEGEGGAESCLTSKSSSVGLLQRRTSPNLDRMSPHQANYWACAIPRSLPPSPDRQSPSWDPDREYEALLDYTYPVRPPGKGRAPGNWLEDLQKPRSSLLQTGDQTLQDSGIELDGLCSSASHQSGLDLWLSATPASGKSKRVWNRNGGLATSPDPHAPPRRSWDSLPLASPIPSHAEPVGLSLESLDSSLDRAGGSRPAGPPSGAGGQYHQQQRLTTSPLFSHTFSSTSSSSAFPGLRSTSLLFPRAACTSAGQWDEEFRPLPDQLEELQSLANQVREVTATLRQPLTLTGSWEALESGDPSLYGTLGRPHIPPAQEGREKVVQAVYRRGVVRPEETAGRGDVTGGGAGGGEEEEEQEEQEEQEPTMGAVSRAVLRDVEALVEQLSGLHSDPSTDRGAKMVSGISRVFCLQLLGGRLIGLLYTVAGHNDEWP